MEFLILLIVTLAIAIVVSALVVFAFRKPVDSIFARIIGEDISSAWRKFLMFALFVVGIASGVQVWKLERFIEPETAEHARPVLTPEFWGLEIYRTIIGALGGLAWALLIFFVVGLIAFAMVRRRETT